MKPISEYTNQNSLRDKARNAIVMARSLREFKEEHNHAVGFDALTSHRALFRGIICLIHLIIVPLKIGFFCGSYFRDSFFYGWIIAEFCTLDLFSILLYWWSRNAYVSHVKQRSFRESFRDNVEVKVSSFRLPCTKNMSATLLHMWRHVVTIPVIEYLVLIISLIVIHPVNLGDSFLYFNIARLTKCIALSDFKYLVRFTWRYCASKFASVNNGFIRLIFLLVAGILLAHILGCFLNALHPEDNVCTLDNEPGDWRDKFAEVCISYISQRNLFNESNAFDLTMCDWCSTNAIEDYVISIYWALTTLATLGYGDIVPWNTGETWYIIFVEVVAFAFYMTLLSNVTALISNQDAIRSSFNYRWNSIKKYATQYRLGKRYISKVNIYFENLWSRHHGIEEEMLMERLPHPLRVKILNSICSTSVANCPLFTSADSDFLSLIIEQCKTMVALPGETIFNTSMIAQRMYGVVSGSIVLSYPVESTGEITSCRVRSRLMFGHIEFVLNCRYKSNARVVGRSVANLFFINKDAFEMCLSLFPTCEVSVEKNARDLAQNWDAYYQFLQNDSSAGSGTSPQRQSSRYEDTFDWKSKTNRSHQGTGTSRVFPESSADADYSMSKFPGNQTTDSMSSQAYLMALRQLSQNSFRNQEPAAATSLGKGIFGFLTRKSGVTQDEHDAKIHRGVPIYLLALSLLFLTYYLVIIPVRFAFMSVHGIEITMFVSYAIDLWFLTDLIYCMVVHYRYQSSLRNPLATKPDSPPQALITEKVTKKQMIIDCCALAPFDLLYFMIPGMSIYWWCWLRMTRVVRAVHFTEYFTGFDKVMRVLFGIQNASTRLVIRSGYNAMLSVIWITCMFTAIGESTLSPHDHITWVVVDYVLQEAKTSNSTLPGYSPLSALFTRATYWCVTTISTVGFGDIVPTNIPELCFATFSIIVGCFILYPSVIGAISTLQGGSEESSCAIKDSHENLDIDIMTARVHKLCTYLGLPSRLTGDIELYLTHMGTKRDQDMSSLPESLREKLMYARYGGLVVGVMRDPTRPGSSGRTNVDKLLALQEPRAPSIFHGCSRLFVMQLCSKLVSCFAPARVVIKARGELMNAVFFVETGLVAEIDDKLDEKGGKRTVAGSQNYAVTMLKRRLSVLGSPAQIYPAGSNFGFKECMDGIRPERPIGAVETSHLLYISESDLKSMIEVFPYDKVTLGLSPDQDYGPQAAIGSRMVSSTLFDDENFEANSGTSDELDDDDDHEAEFTHGKKPWFLYQNTRPRLWISIIIFGFLACTVIMVPLTVGAIINEYCTPENVHWVMSFVLLNITCDIANMISFIFRPLFFVEKSGNMAITNRLELIRRFVLHRRFIYEVLYVFPLDWIVLWYLGSWEYLYIACWCRFIKMGILLTISEYLKVGRRMMMTALHLDYNNVELVYLLLLLLFMTHALACFWMRESRYDDPLHMNWQKQDCVLFGTCFNNTMSIPVWPVGACRSTPLFGVYLRSCYYIMLTLTTVGYGDIVATNLKETFFALALMLVGAFMYASLISSLAKAVANLDKTATAFKKHQEKVRAFCIHRRIPHLLQTKIMTYTTQKWKNHYGGSIGDVIDYLPLPLRQKFVEHLIMSKLTKAVLFEGIPKPVLLSMFPYMKPFTFAPGDEISRAGNPATVMWILIRGEVKLFAEDGKTVLTTVVDSGVFGTEEFYSGTNLVTTLRASTYCDLFMLHRNDFFAVESKYPECKTRLQSNAQKSTEKSDVLKLAGNMKSRKVHKMMSQDNLFLEIPLAKKSIQPTNPWRVKWELAMVFVVLYICLSVPLRLALFLFVNLAQSPLLILWMLFDIIVISGMCYYDMYCQAYKFAFFREGFVVSDLRQIKENYKRTWMYHDIISTAPVDILVFIVAVILVPLRAFELWSLARVLTVLRYRKVEGYYMDVLIAYTSERGMTVKVSLIRLFRKFVSAVIVVHWMACFWFRLSKIEGDDQSWLTLDPDVTTIRAYSRSLYWAVTTFTTIGYGDIVPMTLIETGFALVCLLVSLFVTVDIVANITTYISNIDLTQSRHSALRRLLKHLVHSRRISSSISAGIDEFLDSNTFFAQFGEDENTILSSLSPAVRHDVAVHVLLNPLRSDPILQKTCMPALELLAAAFQYRIYVTGDLFICTGDTTLEFGVIFSGQLKVLLFDVDEEGQSAPKWRRPSAAQYANDASLMVDGDMCGFEMFVGRRSLRSVIAMETSELYVLNRYDYIRIIEAFPKDKSFITSRVNNMLDHMTVRKSMREHRTSSSSGSSLTSTNL